uniref:Ig-like domain-containing protein n=1 Tax=Crocodylus porosus TaxID=8502 RepID=A0A7M4FG29_CROPO
HPTSFLRIFLLTLSTFFTLSIFIITVVPQPTLCQAINGDTAILPCANQTSEKLNMKKYSVYWQVESSVVHFFHNGAESLNNQLKRYQNRTRLFLDQLEHGNFSLILSQVQHGDEAVYTCIYRNGETRAIGKHASKLIIKRITVPAATTSFLLLLLIWHTCVHTSSSEWAATGVLQWTKELLHKYP